MMTLTSYPVLYLGYWLQKYETGADVIGARILYMNNNEKTIEDCINRHKKEGVLLVIK